MRSPKRDNHIHAPWFYNIKRQELFAGLRREGWKQTKRKKHYRFTKEGYGVLIFPYGGNSTLDNYLTARYFRKAGISGTETERILGRKPAHPKKKPP